MNTRRFKVLIVDDDEIVLEVTRELLEEQGHEVHTRSRAFGTTPWILSERPDIVLVDVDMPGLAGNELVRMSRERLLAQATSFIFHSSLPWAALETVVRDTGALGFVPKGGDAQQFVQRFEILARAHCSMPDVAQAG